MADVWKEFSDEIGARFDKGKDLTDNTVALFGDILERFAHPDVRIAVKPCQ